MNWESMTARERDAWIAEHVMGWQRCKGYAMDGKPEHEPWHDPKRAEIPAESFTAHWAWSPTNDAAADYLVLNHVREHWSASVMWTFTQWLHRMWAPRTTTRSTPASLMYRPGDYSHAAFLALKESE